MTASGEQPVWALIPARGGSKSIPKKNIVPLAGKPLIAYGIRAAQKSGKFERIVCSTDDAEIARVVEGLGVEVDWRPEALATDDAAVADVAREFLERQKDLPGILALVQPTSPFLIAEDVVSLIGAMRERHECNSGQTICPVVHNAHAWNQRSFQDGLVQFSYAKERRAAFNKQLKPKLYCFGNLVAVRPRALMSGMDFFAEPSVGVTVGWPRNLDVDAPDDLRLAEAMIAAGLVKVEQ